jgi:hypothetical protein
MKKVLLILCMVFTTLSFSQDVFGTWVNMDTHEVLVMTRNQVFVRSNCDDVIMGKFVVDTENKVIQVYKQKEKYELKYVVSGYTLVVEEPYNDKRVWLFTRLTN